MDPKTTKIRNEGAPQEHSIRTHHHPVHQSVVGRDARRAPPLSVNEALRPANSKTPDTMSTVTAYDPLLTRALQVWIRGKLWHATRLSCRIPVEVLVDTEAEGGNYASLAFTKTVETNLRGGQSIINPSRKGFLRAANPRNSGVSPMKVVVSCVVPMVFSPVDKASRIPFRIVRDLPYAVVLGVDFLKEYIILSAFANYVGSSIMGVKKKEVRNWLDDNIIPTRTFEEQLKLLQETFDCYGKQAIGKPTKIGVLFLGGRVTGDNHRLSRHQACS